MSTSEYMIEAQQDLIKAQRELIASLQTEVTALKQSVATKNVAIEQLERKLEFCKTQMHRMSEELSLVKRTLADVEEQRAWMADKLVKQDSEPRQSDIIESISNGWVYG